MFNPQRIARYLARFLAMLIPILVLVFILSLVIELSEQEADWTDLWISWRFWLAILRDMLPSIIALIAVYLLAVRYVQGLYGLENLTEARGLVNRCLFGLWSFSPWLKVASGTAGDDEGHILRQVGGPGHLVVYNDSVALLERAGQFTRVAETGFPRLERFERIHDVVDLRPKRWVYPVSAMSKEGIPITCEADISYQIDNEGVEPTEDKPYPASQGTVFRAATCTWIREAHRPKDTRTMNWSGRVIISETEGNLRTLLAQEPLDRLIGLRSPDGENLREEIRQKLERRLRAGVPRLGARILRVELGDIKIQDEITQQWIEAWKARWERWATEQEGLGRATQAEQLQYAKTRAQVMLLETITDMFQPLVKDPHAITSKLVLGRLFMVLARAPSDPLTRVNLPKEAMSTLKLIRDLIQPDVQGGQQPPPATGP